MTSKNVSIIYIVKLKLKLKQHCFFFPISRGFVRDIFDVKEDILTVYNKTFSTATVWTKMGGGGKDSKVREAPRSRRP
jgi:hypothetical protein